MTAVTLTAANVSPLPGAVCRNAIAGEAVGLGDIVGINSSTGYLELAQGDSNVVPAGIVVAVANEGAAAAVAGDACSVLMWGPIAGFSGMTPGAVYYLSDTAGDLDTATGTAKVIIGIAWSATVLVVHPMWYHTHT